MSNQPNNKQVSIMAIACVSVVAVTMMVLTAMMNVVNAQVGQPFTDAYLAKKQTPRGLLHGNSLDIPYLPSDVESQRAFLYLVEKERNVSRTLVLTAVAGLGLAVQNSGSYGIRQAGQKLTVAAGTAISIDAVFTLVRGRRILKGKF